MDTSYLIIKSPTVVSSIITFFEVLKTLTNKTLSDNRDNSYTQKSASTSAHATSTK